jgi:four helix bundle protein
MGFSKIEDVIAYQLARAFKLRVYQLVRAHPDAYRDLGYREQLFDSARSGESNVREGFKRYKAPVFYLFLSYARSSIDEAVGWLADGVDSNYFTAAEIAPVAALGYRAIGAAAALQRSLKKFIPRKRLASGRPVPRTILRAPLDDEEDERSSELGSGPAKGPSPTPKES